MDFINILKRVDEIFSGRPYEENKKQFNNTHHKKSNVDSFSNKRFYLRKKHTTLSPKKIKAIEFDLSDLVKEKNGLTETVNIMKEYVNENNRQKLLKEVIELEKQKEKLSNVKKKLFEEVNQLSFQKEILLLEFEEMKQKKKKLLTPNSNESISLDYIDNLINGLDFEKTFAIILDKLNYTDITVTSGSGDFGIDVLATKDDVLYGFQCKLYSNSVGNEAIQEAYTGKTHYNCNIVVVVTNNYFTKQAEKQALETQVILWNRDILEKKINEANQI